MHDGLVWFGFDSLNQTPLVQLASSNTVCQISGPSWDIRHYVNNFSEADITALMKEFYIKAAVNNNTDHIHWGYRQIVLTAMFGIYTPRWATQARNVGCGHCWLTCMDWLQNSGGGGDSVGEVAIFRLSSLTIAWCYKFPTWVEVNPSFVRVCLSYASVISYNHVIILNGSPRVRLQ